MRLTPLALLVPALALLSPSGLSGAPAPRTPVILVTDIGTDIDDSWALALALRSPELELKLVLVDPADTPYRALVAAKFLEDSGHTEVPIAIGDNDGPKGDDKRTLLPWVKGFNLAHYRGRVYTDGVTALIDEVERSPTPVTIIAIGPVHTLALALRKAPDLARKCRLVGMYGSFDVGYGGGAPSPETNVRVNPQGLREVLAAPWIDILFTPLDTCGLVSLDGKRYHDLWCATSDPMVREVIQTYCVFAPEQDWMRCDYFATRSTTLFDCVAVYLAYSEKGIVIETVSFEVTDQGYTRRSPQGPFKARVALRWTDLDAFDTHLTNRILGR